MRIDLYYLPTLSKRKKIKVSEKLFQKIIWIG